MITQADNSSKWWTNLHLGFMGYAVPVLLVASALQNAFTLAALVGMHKGIRRKTRALFIALAVTDLYNLLVWYGVGAFADYGLRYLTHGAFYFRAFSENETVCKLFRGLGYFGIYCSHWLYVLVNADRLLAVVTPHRVQRYNISRYLLLMISLFVVGGIITAGSTAFIYRVKQLAGLGGVYVL